MPQFGIVGGRIDRDPHLTEEGRVEDSLMGLAVCRNKTGTVDGKDNILLQQVHIMDDLVIGTLQEGGVDADYRQHSLAGKARCKGHSMLLCHAHIKETLGVGVCKELQARTVFHGGRDGTDLLVFRALLVQDIAEHRRERLLGSHLRVRDAVDQIKGRNTVEVTGVALSRGIALAFLGHDMQEMGAGLPVDIAQDSFKLRLIVTIKRTIIVEAHILKHGRMIHCPAHHSLAVLDRRFQRWADDRHAIQKGTHIFLGIVIAAGGAQMAQVAGQRAHILGNGHLVVVQDDQQIVQPADIVHPLVDHTAGKGTITNEGNHLSRLAPQLFGPGNAHSQRERGVAVTSNKSIMLTFVGVRETGNAIQLPQLGKALAAAGQQLVGIALMAYIKHDLIRGGGQHPVQSHRQLHSTQIGCQMAAGL